MNRSPLNAEAMDALLVDYLYDELDAGDRAAFEASLPSHPGVKAEVEAHQRTRGLMASLPELEPPALVLADVLREARLAAEPAPTPSWLERLFGALLQPAFAAALVFLTVAGAAWVLMEGGRDLGPGQGAAGVPAETVAQAPPAPPAEGARAAAAAPTAEPTSVAAVDETVARGATEARAEAAEALGTELADAPEGPAAAAPAAAAPAAAAAAERQQVADASTRKPARRASSKKAKAKRRKSQLVGGDAPAVAQTDVPYGSSLGATGYARVSPKLKTLEELQGVAVDAEDANQHGDRPAKAEGFDVAQLQRLPANDSAAAPARPSVGSSTAYRSGPPASAPRVPAAAPAPPPSTRETRPEPAPESAEQAQDALGDDEADEADEAKERDGDFRDGEARKDAAEAPAAAELWRRYERAMDKGDLKAAKAALEELGSVPSEKAKVTKARKQVAEAEKRSAGERAKDDAAEAEPTKPEPAKPLKDAAPQKKSDRARPSSVPFQKLP